MSIPPSHLLCLPRELRDKIYTHLYQSVTLDWKWRATRTRRALIEVTFKEAPVLSVLLTCTQLHDEYVEAKHFKNLSVMLNWGSMTMWRKSQTRSNNGRHMGTVLSRLRHATLITTRDINWDKAALLFDFLRTKSPNLASARIVPRCSLCWISIAELSSTPDPHRLALNSQVPYNLPDLLAGFPLAQVGEGYHIDFGFDWRRGHGANIYEVGVYLYTFQRAWDDWWGPSDILEILPLRENGAELRIAVPEPCVDEIERVRYQIWDWTEKRGLEVQTREQLHHVEASELKEKREDNEGFALWFE
ncbi:hypothetical protein BKA66DRAFT_446565 [Pyrenochaeta sp. MPI-SDFR-AT-0127]|nr:hypothetical protein BKA66DRAFT_446565 [Pyrenochaeta sp. MPI-SDFR-AT-0127]